MWELIGPAQPSANRAGLGSAFRIKAIDIDIAKRRTRCPSGFLSTQCSTIEEAKRQKVIFRLEWSYHSRNCLLRSQSLPARQSHRTIVIGQYHELLQQRRRDQQSPQFKKRMQQRNAIEGTISELSRGHGLPTSQVSVASWYEVAGVPHVACGNIHTEARQLTDVGPDNLRFVEGVPITAGSQFPPENALVRALDSCVAEMIEMLEDGGMRFAKGFLCVDAHC
jgi:hypothetical protein